MCSEFSKQWILLLGLPRPKMKKRSEALAFSVDDDLNGKVKEMNFPPSFEKS